MESADINSKALVFPNAVFSGRNEKWNIVLCSCAIEVKLVTSSPFSWLRSLVTVLVTFLPLYSRNQKFSYVVLLPLIWLKFNLVLQEILVTKLRLRFSLLFCEINFLGVDLANFHVTTNLTTLFHFE